ncbi:MAG: DUF697 domain-containing protein [Candidatus Sericytochromatia bacterium]
MNFKKYFGLFNIKNQILETIENFNINNNSFVTDEEKEKACHNLINTVSKLSGAVAMQPLPFADSFILTPIQVSLVLKIAKVYNKDIDKKVFKEIVSTLIKGLLAKTLARSITKYIPIIGLPTCFTISYITTHSIGLTAIRVFSNKDNNDIEKLKENFEKEFNRDNKLSMLIIKTLNKVEEYREPVLKNKHDEINRVSVEPKNSIMYLPSDN